jgi:hypothetical protein
VTKSIGDFGEVFYGLFDRSRAGGIGAKRHVSTKADRVESSADRSPQMPPETLTRNELAGPFVVKSLGLTELARIAAMLERARNE